MKIFLVTLKDIKIMLKTPKVYLIFFFVWFFIHDYAKPLIAIAQAEQIGIAPYIYPLAMGDWYRTYLVIVMIMFMADVPFRHGANLYMVLRWGRTNWIRSKILTIISVSVLYQVVTYLLSLFALGTNLGVSTKWGDAIQILAVSNAEAMAIGNARAVSEIIEHYAPLQALFYSMLLAILLQMAIGFFIFLVNGVTKSNGGVILTLIVALLDIFLSAFQDFGNIKMISGMMSCVDLSQIYLNEYVAGKMDMYTLILILIVINVGLMLLLHRLVALRWIEVEE